MLWSCWAGVGEGLVEEVVQELRGQDEDEQVAWRWQKDDEGGGQVVQQRDV